MCVLNPGSYLVSLPFTKRLWTSMQHYTRSVFHHNLVLAFDHALSHPTLLISFSLPGLHYHSFDFIICDYWLLANNKINSGLFMWIMDRGFPGQKEVLWCQILCYPLSAFEKCPWEKHWRSKTIWNTIIFSLHWSNHNWPHVSTRSFQWDMTAVLECRKFGRENRLLEKQWGRKRSRGRERERVMKEEKEWWKWGGEGGREERWVGVREGGGEEGKE